MRQKRTNVDLLLVNPPSRYSRSPPLGLLSIASYIRENGFNVKIVDGNTQNLRKELPRYKKVHVVGITATTDRVISAYKVCEFFKRYISKDVLCVLGGIHATAMPKKSLEESMFDMVVAGEGEQTMLEIIQEVSQGKPATEVAGTIVKKGNHIVVNEPRELTKNLDSFPLPAYDLIEIDTYHLGIRGGYGNASRTMPVMIGRGCPFNCVFCSSKIMWRRRTRFFSVDYIVKHVQFLIKNYKVDGIPFKDEEFLVNHNFTHELCDAFIQKGIAKKIVWSCEARVDSVNKDLIKKLKEAGCVLIRFGMESGSQRILNFLKGNTTTVEQNKNAALICRDSGMVCFGSFIIGSPMETIDDIVETVNFIENNMIGHTVAVFTAVPYPSTDLYNICKNKRLFLEGITWDDFRVENHTQSIIQSEYFTARQLTAIKNYVNIHVVERLNLRKRIKKLDHYKEIEKILAGDDCMARYPRYLTVKRSLCRGLSLISKGLRHPQKTVRYLRRRNAHHSNIRLIENSSSLGD